MTTHDEDKIIAQQARIEQLTNFIKYAQVSSGVCCCGDSMEGHPSPMTCGHSPVDMWDYHSGKLLDAYPDDLSALRAHDEKLRAVFQAGAASRDAEVVSLTNQRDYEYVRAENAEQERDQLREQINVLRETLEKACIRIEEYGFDAGEHWKTGRNALASTPEQSLAEYRNKVIEECASVCDKRSMRKNDGNWTDFEWDSICGTNELAADEIRAMKEQP